MDSYRLQGIQGPIGTVAGIWTETGFEEIFRSPAFPPDYLKNLVSNFSVLDLFDRRNLIDRVLSFDPTLSHSSDDIRWLALAFSTDLDLALTLLPNSPSLNLDLAINNHDHVYDLAIALDNGVGLHGMGGIRVRYIETAEALSQGLARALSRDPENIGQNDEINSITRALWRGFAFQLATRPYPKIEVRGLGSLLSRLIDLVDSYRYTPKAFHKEHWISLFRNLIVFEARLDGVLPAIEGLRIIKKRRA